MLSKYIMSHLKPVLIKDPRIIVDNERFFGVLKSGLRFRQKQWTTNSVSISNIPFSTPAPSFDIFIDRRVYFSLPMRYSQTCSVLPNFAVFNVNEDAPRAYPIHSMLNTVTLTINNATITQYIGEIIHALLHLSNSDKLSEYDYSQCPTALDVTQNYADLVGSVRNPLACAGDATQGSIMGRGGFANYKIIVNPVNEGEVRANLTGIVDIWSVEQLMFSPLEFGSLQKNSSAFYNVNTMDWQFNFLSEAATRCWSHANYPNNDDAHSRWISSSVVFDNFSRVAGANDTDFSFPNASKPYLFINYITPDPVISKMYLQKPISYPYFPIARYVTPIAAKNYGAAPEQIVSNNIQLSNIPKKLVIYFRSANNPYYTTPTSTDSFFGINYLSIQFQNYSGLLAESNQAQLWELARKNHCNIDWSSWSGNGQYPVAPFPQGNFPLNQNKYGGLGSLVVLEMGTDIQLDPEYAPGSIGQFSLQITANIFNIDPSNSHNGQELSMYILCINDGVFTIPSGGVAFSELSLLTTKDVVEATMQTDNDKLYLNYNDLQEVSGGNFYTGIKDFGKSIGRKLGQANKYLKDSRLISNTANKISNLATAPFVRDIPYSDKVANVARDVHDVSSYLGYGKGGSVLGAGRLGKNKISERLSYL